MKALIGSIRFRIVGLLILAIALFSVGVLTLEPTAPERFVLYGGLLLLIGLAAALLHGVNRPLDRLVRSLRAGDPALLASLARQETEFGQLDRKSVV